ncbi:MAG: hypothetical protein HZB61_10110 [Nitrospirae bacterium]|nr:hypothetical protein [Nitrospirota bacterium]
MEYLKIQNATDNITSGASDVRCSESTSGKAGSLAASGASILDALIVTFQGLIAQCFFCFKKYTKWTY